MTESLSENLFISLEFGEMREEAVDDAPGDEADEADASERPEGPKE